MYLKQLEQEDEGGDMWCVGVRVCVYVRVCVLRMRIALQRSQSSPQNLFLLADKKYLHVPFFAEINKYKFII